MKKIFTSFAFAGMALFSYAQSQRLVLTEEFSNASCGPCASQNPAFFALIDANPSTKIIALKYQVSWPGYDPMYSQNSSQSDSRVSYYGVTGVPYALLDGTPISGPNYLGAPANATQTAIDNQYAVASPFDIVLSHSFSADYDSIFIHAVVKATDNVSSGSLVAQIALIEHQINFPSAPGTNGETVFHGVMREMFPSTSGTSLTNSWAIGDSVIIDIAEPVPSYIYDLNEASVIAFVQNNTDKSIKQAAFSEPIPMTLDAGVSVINAVNLINCSNSINPTILIKNYGLDPLNSADVVVKVDNVTVGTYPWTGSIATGATGSFIIPTITSTAGTHTLSISVTNPNGSTDFNVNNNDVEKVFSITSAAVPSPLVETYQATTFPPTNWLLNNEDGDAATWTRKTGAGGFGYSSACAKMDFFNSAPGNVDEFYMPVLNLATVSAPQYLKFSVAYAQYSTEDDVLDVSVSTNCGASWTSVYYKSGMMLATTTPVNPAAFTPTAGQWRGESINMAAYVGFSSIMVRFKATSDYGNNLYIDDINMSSSATSIDEDASLESNLSISPNPFNDQTKVEFNLAKEENVKIEVYNVLGKLVHSADQGSLSAGNHAIIIKRESMTSGIYFVNLTIGDKVVTEKITVK